MKNTFNQEYKAVYDNNKIIAINIITKDVTDEKSLKKKC